MDNIGVLYLGNTKFLFDLEDIEQVKHRDWFLDKDGYLASTYLYHGKICFSMFHREVMHALPGQVVDHINRNRADNRKQNLRLCSRSENNMNRGLFSNNSSGIAGVYFDAERGKWAANIMYGHKRIFLGRFADKEAAIAARREKEIELFREFSTSHRGC